MPQFTTNNETETYTFCHQEFKHTKATTNLTAKNTVKLDSKKQ